MLITAEQRLRICRALARRARQEHLIGPDRPTPEFFGQVESATCSTGEWLLLHTAHAIWSGATSAGPTVGLMFFCMERRDLEFVGKLLQALSADDDRELEAWLARAGCSRLEAV